MFVGAYVIKVDVLSSKELLIRGSLRCVYLHMVAL
jgi:hypothetical protein